MINKYFIHVFFSILICSCSGGEAVVDSPIENTDIIPKNLVLNIEIVGKDINNPNGDGSGKIICTATASDAINYKFKFGNNTDEVSSASGVLEHTFSTEGMNSYLVTVFAFSSTEHSISVFKTINVYVTPIPSGQLIWSDEFNVNGTISSTNWSAETVPPNNGSWWNNEVQHYTDRTENIYVSDGTLKIIAKKENYTFQSSTKNYTSARINTKNKFNFTYGLIEVRAKLPSSMGTWPAIWMLGSNDNIVGWPACGEIDIMEQTGWKKENYLSTIHWADNGNHASYGTNDPNSHGENFSVPNSTTGFHVYKFEWTENSLTFYVDDDLSNKFEMNNNSSLPFDSNFYLILNLALGGSLGGAIDSNFTQDILEIDYVRVYK